VTTAVVRVTERQLQAQVVQLAQLNGWRCYHTFDSRRSAPGFPPLVLARPPCLIFAELKSEKGRLRPAQVEWLEALAEVERAPEVYLWRPGDFGDIQSTLRRGAA
jgi:hypothetical protein